MTLQSLIDGSRRRLFLDRKRSIYIAACLLCLASWPPRSEARNWALLIGIGTYQDVERWRPLPAANDVALLTKTLVERSSNFDPQLIETLRDRNAKVLRSEITRFLGRPASGDLVVIYFSGHGYKTKAGLYLAATDFDARSDQTAKDTGIELNWLRREIAKCKAKDTFLIVDSCYAGTPAPAAEDIQGVFRGDGDVVTLASSKTNEMSIVWTVGNQSQSLFSYWLNQALIGHADADMNGEVTFDEIYDFVHPLVLKTSKGLSRKTQTPVYERGFSVAGDPVLIRLRPQRDEVVIRDMAQQIGSLVDAENRSLSGGRGGLIAVWPEFTDASTIQGQLEPHLSGKYGTLSGRLAHDLYKELRNCSIEGWNFNLVPYNEFNEVIGKRNATPQDLGATETSAQIANDISKSLVQVCGQFRYQRGSIVGISAVATTMGATQREIGKTGGTVDLTVDDWVELGKSGELLPEDFQRKPAVGHYKSIDASAIENLESPARLAVHPMQNQDSLFRVAIRVRDKHDPRRTVETKPKFAGNNAYVALREGDEYVIRVEYPRGDRRVLMKLLVDGVSINTNDGLPPGVRPPVAPQPFAVKAIAGELVKPVSVQQMRVWVLDPTEDPERIWEYEGYYANGKQAYPFVVVNAAQSLATERRYFGEDIGMITAAFYEDGGVAMGDLGTQAGELRSVRRDVRMLRPVRVGRPIAVITIRYVSPQAFGQLR